MNVEYHAFLMQMRAGQVTPPPPPPDPTPVTPEVPPVPSLPASFNTHAQADQWLADSGHDAPEGWDTMTLSAKHQAAQGLVN